MNDDIMYIKHSIKKSVSKLTKKAYNIKEEIRKYIHNTVYL